MMEFNSNGKLNFTGKALTLADLENSFKKEFGEELSEKARGSWRYFGFDLKNEWKAVTSGSEAIIVVDEACDLNMSSVFPDLDSFISWLEVTYDEREAEKEREKKRETVREAEREGDKETEKNKKKQQPAQCKTTVEALQGLFLFWRVFISEAPRLS